MPPEYQWILDGGLPAGMAFVIAWLDRERRAWKQRAETAEERAAQERAERDREGREAATALYEQKLITQQVEGAISLRDYRIEDLQRDLERCERKCEALRSREAAT